MPNFSPSDRMRWEGNPGAYDVRKFDIVRADPRGSIKLVAVNQSVEGVYVHWIEGRTVPCMGAENGCPYHTGNHICKWLGYLACIVHGTGKLVLAEITHAAFSNTKALQDLNGKLRGYEIVLSRRGTAKNAPVQIALDMAKRHEIRAPYVDVRAALCRIWNGIGRPKKTPPRPRYDEDDGPFGRFV